MKGQYVTVESLWFGSKERKTGREGEKDGSVVDGVIYVEDGRRG